MGEPVTLFGVLLWWLLVAWNVFIDIRFYKKNREQWYDNVVFRFCVYWSVTLTIAVIVFAGYLTYLYVVPA